MINKLAFSAIDCTSGAARSMAEHSRHQDSMRHAMMTRGMYSQRPSDNPDLDKAREAYQEMDKPEEKVAFITNLITGETPSTNGPSEKERWAMGQFITIALTEDPNTWKAPLLEMYKHDHPHIRNRGVEISNGIGKFLTNKKGIFDGTTDKDNIYGNYIWAPTEPLYKAMDKMTPDDLDKVKTNPNLAKVEDTFKSLNNPLWLDIVHKTEEFTDDIEKIETL